MVAFGGGLLMSDYARTALEPGAVMGFLPKQRFRHNNRQLL